MISLCSLYSRARGVKDEFLGGCLNYHPAQCWIDLHRLLKQKLSHVKSMLLVIDWIMGGE